MLVRTVRTMQTINPVMLENRLSSMSFKGPA